MTDVETDPATLKASYTPKQRENFENHVAPLLDKLDRLKALADEKGADFDVAAAKKWYMRTYRPKKRGDGVMKRDHVGIGEPEHLFVKELEKLGNAWGSIEGLVMASLGIDEETEEEVTDAAVAVYVARHLGSKVDMAKLAQSLEEHKKVGALYGV